ncbi:hypothetical protein [Coraliomargarita akajimensis]|nr:hypothetical protein [Coraliomargarita akajimensis]
MKSIYCSLFAALTFATATFLQAQDATAEEKEISSPPFAVGDLADEAGYYIELGEGAKLNFRMVATKMRVYWMDADGLIIEPPAKTGNVRFNKTQSGKKFYELVPVSGDAGLGSYEVIRFPHTFNLVLNVKDAESGQVSTYPFRYIQTMSAPRTPEAE